MRLKNLGIGIFSLLLVVRMAAGGDDTAHRWVIDSPLDYQVFQRQSRLQGIMHIRGQIDATGTVDYRLTGKPLEGELDSTWHVLTTDPTTRRFAADIKTFAGGWYRLEFALREDGKVTSRIAIDHVGIGEVFVITGQSNSTNYGKPRQHSASGRVSAFDGHGWHIADDPQPGVQDRSTGGSFIPAFGNALVERFNVPVGVACVGAGGTSVREWLAKGERMNRQPTTGRHVRSIGPNEWESTGELFGGLSARMRQLGPGGFRAILWHQGESDAHQARQITAEQYRTWLELLIQRSKQIADVPWFVAQATYHSELDPKDDEFRAAQKSLWQDGVAEPGPDTDQLGSEYRNGVHFNETGLKAHGRLWAQKVAEYLDQVLKPAPK